jgi:hypothetical protein
MTWLSHEQPPPTGAKSIMMMIDSKHILSILPRKRESNARTLLSIHG